MLSPVCERFRTQYEPHDGAASNRHRRDCPACAQWAARLDIFLVPEPPLPMPAGLRRRLRAIAAPPPLPWWIRDGSAAMAASLALALCFSLLIDARSLAVSASQVIELGDAKGRAAAVELTQALEKRRVAVLESAETLNGRFYEIREFFHHGASELYEHAASLTSERAYSQGDDDGKP